MQKFKWLVGGMVLGFIAAHFVSQNPSGREFFERVNQGAKEFNDAFSEGYKQGGSPSELIEDMESALDSLKHK